MSEEKVLDQDFLHFSPDTQDAIVGWMLTDNSFFLKCKVNIDFTYFSDPVVSELVKMAYDIHDTYGRPPRKGDLETSLNVVRFSASDVQKKLATLTRCMISKETRSLDILSHEMTSWKKLILLRRSFPKATTLYNSGKYSDAAIWLKDELTRITQVNFGKEAAISFDDGLAFYEKRERDTLRNRCTLGHPFFDEAVFQGSALPQNQWVANHIETQTSGSLVPGAATMLLGPSNAGKTTTVTTCVFYNLMFKKKVLLITLEEIWEDMKHYLNQCISGLQADKFNNMNDPEVINGLTAVSLLTKNSLVYVDGVRSGKMFVEDVCALVEIEQEKMRNIRAIERNFERTELRKKGKLDSKKEEELLLQDEENRGFDLVIIDYPGKLKARSLGKNAALHEEQGYIYNKFVELANIHRFHALLPVQTNREGYKAVNNKKDENDGIVVDQGHIANSFGIAQVASNIITINRNQRDIQMNRIKYYIAKTRTAPATACFVSKTDFSRRRAYGIYGLTGGLIKAGESITDQSVCQALGDAVRSTSELPEGMPIDKVEKELQVQEDTQNDDILRPEMSNYDGQE